MTHNVFISICLCFCLGLFSQARGQSAFPTVSISATSVSCPGGSDASAQAFLSGQTPGYSYTYLWSTGATTPSVLGLTAGVYSVTVTESPTGYQFFDLVIIAEPDPIGLSFNLTDVPCFGQSTGAIDLSVSGGTTPYSYNWTNAGGQNISSSQDISNLTAGIYRISVTDSRGCSNAQDVALSSPNSAVDHQITRQNVSCFLGSDGSLSASAFGGTPPYTYDWNNGTFASPNLTNLPIGNYDLLVTDANGCTSSSSNLLTQPTAIQVAFSPTNVSCFGGTNGSIDVSVSGGSSPYAYSWTSSLLTLGNSQDLSGLSADSYFLTLTDNKGCTENISVNLSQPSEISLQAQLTPVACAGQATGAIDLSASGGVLPYSYVWTNSAGTQIDTTQDISSLIAGDYTVELTDDNGCIKTLSRTITEPDLPLGLEFTKVDVLCFGENTGSIDLSVSGGTPPYQYNWSNGLTTEDLGQLVSGSYSVQVMDANGCIENTSVVIEQPAAALAVSAQITAVSCFGLADGAISLNVSGGSTPYAFAWANSQFNLSFTSQNLSDIPSESYFLLLTDDNGCLLRDTLLVDQPDAFKAEIVQTDVLCFGESTGSIDLSLTGGTQPYVFQWSNGSFQEDLEGVTAGAYELQVRDDQGCLYDTSFVLSQPLAPLGIQTYIKDATCAGGRDGSIDYEANGGTPPYTYVWSNNSTDENQFELQAGLYSVLLTDAAGCTRSDSLEVGQPDFFDITADVTPVKCAGESSGSLRLNIGGGSAPYEFVWRNSEFVLFAQTQDLINFPSETYSVLVTDTFGCKGEATFLLPQPDSFKITVFKTDVSCFGANDGMIELQAEGGVEPYSFLWGSQGSGPKIEQLEPGLYEAFASDANGCGDPLGIEILEPEPLRMLAAVEPASCIDKPDGRVDLFVRGGRKNYRYFYNDEELGNPANKLLGATYNLRVEDQSGCRLDSVLEVPFVDAPCLDIPNAFSPNGDGKNDRWRIKDLNIYPNPRIIIFNQWGTKLYESSSNQFEWDGYFGGNPLPAQTYYYVIRPKPDRAEISGSITIVR